MFICKNCKSVDKFELMFAPGYKGAKNYKQEYNKNKDIVITVDADTRLYPTEFYEPPRCMSLLRTDLYVGL